MSIKSLFNNKTTTVESAASGSKLVESKDLVLTTIQRDETFYPFIDFASASNFAKFGSAEEYYKNSIERIHNNYPYDGSENEKLVFELSSSYLDKYILDNRYPKTNGYVNLSYGGWGTQASTTDGYGLPDDTEYIYLRGGIHVADDMTTKPLQQTFDKSVSYDAAKKRTTSLRMNIPQGLTTEFWLKKEAFDLTKTNKEVILDLWNGEDSSSVDYGRFTLALSGTTSGEDTFIVTMQSGTTGFFEQSIGTATVTTSSLSNWHHYALSFVSASTGVTSRLYVDGDLNESKSMGSTGINEIGGLINGYIGALQASPSGSSATQYSGKLSASLDDFRFWKIRRTSEEIYNNWYRHVGGGTNTDDANTYLGVYYKFNEGIVGNTQIDSNVLDYSGRLVNGTWTGYASGARSVDSAFVESGLIASEEKDPIIYSTHPTVSSLKTELMTSGSKHDKINPGLLYNKVPQWIKDEDPSTGDSTKKLYQIISSYFDTLHVQIQSLPYLKNKVYPSSSYKPLPFADRLLEEKGLIVSNLFADSTVLEAFGQRDLSKIQFEEKVTDIKNQIYTNIYNNLESIYKHKGTEGAIRNMLRCFGVDDELVKLNIYTDQGTHYFSDTFKHSSLNKKYIDFNKKDRLAATVFQTSSVNNSLTYISGSGAEKLEQYNAMSSEVSILVPKKVEFPNPGWFATPFQSASVFGMHTALGDSSDYSWPDGSSTSTPQTASIEFTMVTSASLEHEATLQLTAGSDSALIVSADPNQALATDPSTIDHIIYTGSYGLNLKVTGSGDRRFRTGTGLTGLEVSDSGYDYFSLSFWYYLDSADIISSIEQLFFLDSGGTVRLSVLPHIGSGDIRITSTTGSSGENITFSSAVSDTDQWNHFSFHFDLTDPSGTGYQVTLHKNNTLFSTETFAAGTGFVNDFEEFRLIVDDKSAIGDVVVRSGSLLSDNGKYTSENNQWVNPNSISSSNILGWYKLGYDSYFGSPSNGDLVSTVFPGSGLNLSSSAGSYPFMYSYGSSQQNDRLQFFTSVNPFGDAKIDTTIRNELTAALNTVFSTDFGDTTYTGADGATATFTLKSGSAGPSTIAASEISSSFVITATNDGDPIITPATITDLANFQVYLVRDEVESSSGKFLLKDYDGNITLESPVYKEVYSNEPWNLSVRVKPEDYPIAGNVVTSSNRNYILEFYGVTHAFDTIKNEFTLTQSLNYETGSAYLSSAKRFYLGAHRTNFTGSTLEQTDIKAGRFNLWYDYIDNDTVKVHNKDITSKGNKRTSRPSTMFSKDLEGYQIPSYELMTADWDFETVSSTDGSGEFTVIDTTSGSTDTRYGWIDNIVRRENSAKGFGFPASSDVLSNEIVYSSKKELPEISYSSDGVRIMGEKQEYFIEDEDVSDNFYALEKSMYQTISEEMMRTLSTAQEMSNLMGEAVERYRLEYKKLNYVRRMFFEDVEQDPDFDRFTEYFKWIDSSVSYMVSQMFPLSVRFSKGISDVVESHIFERNKYQNKFPLITTHTATEGRMVGVGQSKYRWEFGHAPIDGGDNDNCLWQKERAERTDIADREIIREAVENRNNAQGTIVSKSTNTTGTYTTSKYGVRNFSKPLQMNVVISQTFHPGINYNLQKDNEYIWSAVNRHSALSPTGIPKNVLLVGAGEGQGIELPVECDDIETPNQKKKFNTIVHVGKESTGSPGGSFNPINDSASYSFAVKGAFVLPFNIFSGSIATGYNEKISNGYKSDAVVTNIHSDTTDFSNDLPLQGPFARQWVGGHQSRHIDLNRYDAALFDDEAQGPTPNNIQNLYTRPEAWRLLVIETGGGSDGSLGMADPQYGQTAVPGHPHFGKYPDVAKKSAVMYRDGRTKRAMNIANIQTTTSSVNHGNYRENYEIITVASPKEDNNLYFRKNSDTHDFIPPEIGAILPETTNYQTLVGVSNHPNGNVFGVGESNILNAVTEILIPAASASMEFAILNAGTLTDGGILHLTGGATQVSAEITVDETIESASDIIVEPRRRAFKAIGDSSAIAQNTSYTGLGSSDFSISFWTNNFKPDNSNSGYIRFNRADGEYLYYFGFNNGTSNDSRVLVRTGSLGTAGQAVYNTSFTTEWVQVVITFDVGSLNTAPNLFINNSPIASTGYSHGGGAAGTITQIDINLDDEYGLQDLVIWNKVLGAAEISELYNFGDWLSPDSHSANGNIVDWYMMGEEDYWYDLGYRFNDVLSDIGGSTTRYVSSSYGSGANELSIGPLYDEDFLFTAGVGERSSTDMFNRLSSSLSSSFPEFQVSYTTGFMAANFSLNAYTAGALEVDISETGLGFGNPSSVDGTDDSIETGYINTTTIATGSVTRTVISSRFSAPGSIDTMTYGFLDAYSQEYSVYNNLNYRNLSVRGVDVRVSSSADGSDFYNFGGSGEAGTIRVNDHRNARDGMKALLSRHSGKFGIDPRYAAELGSDPLEQANPDPSFHKQQRNESRRPSDTSTVLAPVLTTRNDNMYINTPIPRSDFQYTWVTSSLGSNYSITSGKQRMYGYAHPTGILSSSVVIDGDSGFVPAITFPTASEIFGV
jgi:hypothetical protein